MSGGLVSVPLRGVHTPHEPSGLVTVTDGVVTSHHGVVSAERGTVEVVQSVVADLVSGSYAAEQVLVEVLAERLADEVESDGVDARVDVAQTETHYSESVPDFVVVVMRVGIEVKP